MKFENLSEKLLALGFSPFVKEDWFEFADAPENALIFRPNGPLTVIYGSDERSGYSFEFNYSCDDLHYFNFETNSITLVLDLIRSSKDLRSELEVIQFIASLNGTSFRA